MPAVHFPELGRTYRSAKDILADANAAEVFWASLDQLDDARRAAIIREAALSDPLTVAVSEAAAWNRR